MTQRLAIKKAVVLSAGLGTRLRPYTDTTPKPLIQIGGQPILLRILDTLARLGFEEVVVNTHYLAEKIEHTLAHFKTPLTVHISREPELLGAGGGLRQAAHRFYPESPFLVINGDCVWQEEKHPRIRELVNAFDPEKMDALLSISPWDMVEELLAGDGFFTQTESGQVTLHKGQEMDAIQGPHYAYASLQVMHPRILREIEPGHKAPLLPRWLDAQEKGRLYGHIYHGMWADMGTHRGLLKAEEMVTLRTLHTATQAG